MLAKLDHITIEALTATVSKQRTSVEERCRDMLVTKKVSRIMRGTGIENLSIAKPEVCTSDLCVEAAFRLFDEGWNPDDIGALIFITQTADYLTPATSFYLQNRLKIPTNALCFDINLGCSGFVYGVYIASMLLSSFSDEKKVLLLCGDTSSRNAYPRETAMLSIAGDAGAAAIIGKQNTGTSYFYLESFGDRADYLLVARGGYRAVRITDTAGNLTDDQGNYVVMDGMGVMNFSLDETPNNIQNLLQYAGIERDELDIGLFHQANQMIVSSIAQKIGLPVEKAPFRSEKIGNTSSASIPVCLSEMARRKEIQPWKCALLSGFGVGMSVASALMDLSHMKVLGTGEL